MVSLLLTNAAAEARDPEDGFCPTQSDEAARGTPPFIRLAGTFNRQGNHRMHWVAICSKAGCNWAEHQPVVAQAICSKWKHEWQEPEHKVAVFDSSERQAMASFHKSDASVAESGEEHAGSFLRLPSLRSGLFRRS